VVVLATLAAADVVLEALARAELVGGLGEAVTAPAVLLVLVDAIAPVLRAGAYIFAVSRRDG
jgi:hypothetical protein